MKSVAVTDLGGTKTRCGLLGEDWSLLAESERPTIRELDPFLEGLFADLDQLIASCEEVDPPTAIGLATAGVVRGDRRVVHYAPNLPIPADFDFASVVEDRFGLPCSVINDGRASAVGEFVGGAARGADPLLALFFGTGIGIGLVVGGEPYGGVANAAGEVGHTVWIPGGRRCPCGRDGCFEAYCAGRAITERAAAEIEPGAWTVGDVAERARQGDRAAIGILHDAEVAAGAMVANLCTVLNPAAVVLGGGMLKGWPELATSIEDSTRSWCANTVTQDLRFERSRDDSDAILRGAAAATGVFAD